MTYPPLPPCERSSDRIDLVLPLALERHGHSDVERSRMLFESLVQRFDADSLGTIFVVCQQDCVPEIERRLRDYSLPTRFLDERDVIGRTTIGGWRKQQLIKLAIAERCTEFYLALDADLICRRPVGYRDLVCNGRGVVDSCRKSIFEEWYRDSAATLGIDLNLGGDGIGVTPQVLCRDAVALLARHLERRHRRPWREVLGASERWTEFTLYGLFLERHDLFELFHVRGTLAGRNVWKPHEFDDWSLDEKAPGFFSVVQSNAGISPDRVRRKLER